MIKYGLTLVVAILFVSQCHGLEDCGSTLGELIKLTVSGCENLDQRCTLRRDENVTLTMQFNLNNDVTHVKSVVHGVILGIPIPFNLPQPNGCDKSGLTCPVKKGGPYTYTATLPVEKSYPKVTVDVKWELQNENNEDILCVLIPSKIH